MNLREKYRHDRQYLSRAERRMFAALFVACGAGLVASVLQLISDLTR